MPDETFSPSLSIAVGHFEDRRSGRREVGAEIVGDYYVAVLALRQSRLKVLCNGKLMQNGPIMPGMMRLAAPGERLEIVLDSP